MADGMKLYLSVDALERLMGGDSEAEIRVRNSVVQEFARRHLKAVANSEAMRLAEQTVKKTIDDEFVEKRGVFGVTLSEEYREAIKNEVREKFGSALFQAIGEVRNELHEEIKTAVSEVRDRLMGAIDLRIKKEVTDATVTFMKAEIEKRLRELAAGIMEG